MPKSQPDGPAVKARLLETYRGQLEGAMGLSGTGFGIDLLVSLLFYVVTVIAGLLLFQTVGYALVLRLAARREPLDFFRRVRLVTA